MKLPSLTHRLSSLAIGCSAHTQPAPTMRVLFIGNSLTSTNNLPGMLEALSRTSGGPRIDCESIAFPNYSLEDHWNRGDAAKAIARGGWRDRDPAAGTVGAARIPGLAARVPRKFGCKHPPCRREGRAGTMVWPFSTRRGDFDGVKASYQAAARDVGGLLLPVGEAWRAVWRRDAKISLCRTRRLSSGCGSDVSGGARHLSTAHGHAPGGDAAVDTDCSRTLRRYCAGAAAEVIAIQWNAVLRNAMR